MDGVRVAWTPVGDPPRDAAWRLLRSMLPEGAELSNPCPRCGGPHGPVLVTGAPFVASVSYAGDLAVVAIGESSRFAAIGVDAEPERDQRRDAAGLDGVLGAGAASLRSWTRVEAALKADGRGLRVDPAAVRVSATSTGWAAVVPGAGPYAGWDAEGPAGVIVSVAVRPVSAEAAPGTGPATA